MIEETLKKSITNALGALTLDIDLPAPRSKASRQAGEIHLEHPTDLLHGDYSTNVAMALAKKTGRNPKELAEEVVRYIEQHKPKEIEKVEVAGPGFINFFLSKEFFAERIADVLKQGEKWGSNKERKGKKVMVEYTDPNPFKEFHIGHLMSNAIGESLSRVIEYSGAEVKRVNYQGDVGLHVAKAVWALKKAGEEPTDVKTLGEAYSRGTWAYEEDEEAKKEINDINRKIYEKSDEGINKLYTAGRKISLDYFEILYKKLGTKFDYYFFESDSGPRGKKLVEEGLAQGIFEKSEGAIVFYGEKHGLHTRVFINTEGLPTYEAKDLGLSKIKYEKYPYDLSIVVTGNEIAEYFKVLLKAMESIFSDLAKKTQHIPHGMMRLSSGKMSSRTGDVITGESLIEAVQNRVLNKMKDVNVENKEMTAEQIAVGAIKYSVLKQATGKDIVFDMEKSLSFEGDSGPYLQYAHTRAQSVLVKADFPTHLGVGHPNGWEVTELERLLYRFPEVVIRAQKEYEPHYIVTYLTMLAGAFNSYYAHKKILDESADMPYKLVLVKAFATTIKNGLWLLGIKVPERM